MGRRPYRRREALAAGATGLVTVATGCLGLFESDPGPDLSTVAFAFAYDLDDGGGSVTIEHAEGDALPARNLRVRTSDGDGATWSELGSTVERPDETVGPGSTARIGADVLNWPSAVRPGELVRVVYRAGEQSVTELGRFVQPTPTPGPTPTPVPGLITGFEDGHLDEWTLTETGATGEASWEVTTDRPHSGEYAARYRGDRNAVLASTSGLEPYPSRGDTFEFRFYKQGRMVETGFGFGVQSPAYHHGYHVFVRSADRRTHPQTAVLRRWEGPDFSDRPALDRTDHVPDAYRDQYLRWVVDWGDPTITVRAFAASGERLLSLSADDATYDSGGIALRGNAPDPATIHADTVRFVE